VILIDDSDTLDDPGNAIITLLNQRLPELHLIIAGRADTLRSAYGHWTQQLRRSRSGVLLRPDVNLDGDLLGVRLPRRAPVPALRIHSDLVGRCVVITKSAPDLG
jgi:DNA segregation ATPase FtsK/SpoIIIE, S-DNA-T family